jgi:predicted ATP-dependent protease
MMRDLELKPEQLRQTTDPALFGFADTRALEGPVHVIGQDRAVRAIDFGVDMPSPGYNVYAMGPAGSGRTTAVRQYLDRHAAERPAPDEWCYVYNFDDPRRPRALRLPPGFASGLRRDMADLVQQLRQEIPRAFEGEHYEQRRREIMLAMQERQQELYRTLEAYLNERGFALIRSQMGLAIAPMVEGQVLSGEDYQKLDPERKKQFEAFRPELQEQFDRTMRQARDLDRQAKESIDHINDELTGFVADNLMTEIQERFGCCPDVVTYLAAVRKDVVANAARFVGGEGEQPGTPAALLAQVQQAGWFSRYEINVLDETGDRTHAPVVIEDNPTYHNLVGRIEHRAEFGAMVTDFTQIRAGALHRANGGYLVVAAKDALTNALAWEGLKRALRNRQIKIEEMSQFYGLLATASLDPEPIPLDVKVVLIGDENLYGLLYAYDEDFRELFKVRAEFTPDMPRDDHAAQEYALFVADLTRRENLRPFDAGAMARLFEEASRLADDQGKVTTRFAETADLVREAPFWAGRARRDV